METSDKKIDHLSSFIKQLDVVVHHFKQLTTDPDRQSAFDFFLKVEKSLRSLLSDKTSNEIIENSSESDLKGPTITSGNGLSAAEADSEQKLGKTVHPRSEQQNVVGVELAEEVLNQIKSVLEEPQTSDRSTARKTDKLDDLHKRISNLEKENRHLKTRVYRREPSRKSPKKTRTSFVENSSAEYKPVSNVLENNSKGDSFRGLVRKSSRKTSLNIRKLLEFEDDCDEAKPLLKRKRQSTQHEPLVIKAAEKAPKLQVDPTSNADNQHNGNCSDSSDNFESANQNDEEAFSDSNTTIWLDTKQKKEIKRRPGRPRKRPIRIRPVRHHEKIVRHTCKICQKRFTHGRPFHKHLLEHGSAGASCRKCKKTFHNEAEFLHHVCQSEKISNKAKPKCEHCGEEFVNQRKLRIHLQRTHAVTPECAYCCPHCEQSFNTRSCFVQHLKEHEGNRELCLKCDLFLKTPDEFLQHMQEHRSNAAFVCEFCDEAFEQKQEFVVHLFDHKKYNCMACDETFPQKDQLSQHYKDSHDTPIPEMYENDNYSCEVCNVQFEDDDKLQDHFRLHTGGNNTKCRPCGMIFQTEKALLRHKYTSSHVNNSEAEPEHQNEYLCSSCGKSYFTKAALQRHMRYHIEVKPYSCKHCDYTCREHNNLKRHMDLHFSERNFVCEICGAAFHAKKTLETHHIYKHEQQREFKCTECALSFKTRSSLKRHLRIHSQTRPHKCQSCGSGFNRLYNLRRHMKAVHGDDKVLPPVNRVKLLDAPPGMEYHKGPAALGLQGKPKTPAQLLEECEPGGHKDKKPKVKTDIQIKSDNTVSDQQISTQVVIPPMGSQNNQSNIVAQAAAAVGLDHALGESKDMLGVSSSRLIYQANPTGRQVTPVAIEMKLNANEAAQIQAEFQRQQQQLIAAQQKNSAAQIQTVPLVTVTASSNNPQPLFTIPLTHQSTAAQKLVTSSQVTNPVLQRSVAQIVTQESQRILSSTVSNTQTQILHQQINPLINQQLVNSSINSQSLLGLRMPVSGYQNNIQIAQPNVQQQLNHIQPQAVLGQEKVLGRPTLQQHHKHQPDSQQQPPAVLQQQASYNSTLPVYAQDVFTATNTVSNLAQMRELIHGTPQANQNDLNQQ